MRRRREQHEHRDIIDREHDVASPQVQKEELLAQEQVLPHASQGGGIRAVSAHERKENPQGEHGSRAKPIPEPREHLAQVHSEVDALILQGLTTQETADVLFISVATVKTHLQHIYEKTGVRNRAELARVMGGAARGNKITP